MHRVELVEMTHQKIIRNWCKICIIFPSRYVFQFVTVSQEIPPVLTAILSPLLRQIFFYKHNGHFQAILGQLYIVLSFDFYVRRCVVRVFVVVHKAWLQSGWKKSLEVLQQLFILLPAIIILMICVKSGCCTFFSCIIFLQELLWREFYGQQEYTFFSRTFPRKMCPQSWMITDRRW